MNTNNALVITDTPDNIDYAKLRDAHRLAVESGCSVVLHNICHECPSITTVPPTARGQFDRVTFEHEDWCPVLAHHEGRQLTPTQQRRHRRYMDGTNR
jgi:hypothetical protein